MAGGRRGTVVASALLIASAWQLGGCGDSSSHGPGSTSPSGAPSSAGPGGTTSNGGVESRGGAPAGFGGRVPVGGIGATSGSGDAGRGTTGGAASGGIAGAGAGTGGTGLVEAGAAGTSAGAGETAGRGGTAGVPDFSCPEAGTCYVDCDPAASCVRVCKLDSFMFGSDARVAELSALKCEIVEGALIFYGDVTSLAGLETIRSVSSQVSIEGAGLDDISGLSGLETVAGRLLLGDLPVTEVEFPALKELGDELVILSLGSVQRIALPQLTNVGTNVEINSTAATEIDLDALEHVNGTLRISANQNLPTLHELPSLLDAVSLQIDMNPNLPQCEAEAIATRLNLMCLMCTGNSAACP